MISSDESQEHQEPNAESNSELQRHEPVDEERVDDHAVDQLPMVGIDQWRISPVQPVPQPLPLPLQIQGGINRQ